MSNHLVVVGNIGTVYEGKMYFDAQAVYHEYVRQSKTGYGRASNEGVIWFIDNKIQKEHHAKEDSHGAS